MVKRHQVAGYSSAVSKGSARTADGFTVLGLLIAVVVINIALGVAVTRWSFVMKRHREAELIWRGEQYARALGCYVQSQGKPPARLEDLVEESCIRRLYRDPMTQDGEWELIRASEVIDSSETDAIPAQLRDTFPGMQAPAADIFGQVESGAGARAAGGSVRDRLSGRFENLKRGLRERIERVRQRTRQNIEERRRRIGAPSTTSDDGIVGVVSRSADESVREYQGLDHYNEWRFYAERTAAEDPTSMLSPEELEALVQSDDLDGPGASRMSPAHGLRSRLRGSDRRRR